MVIDLDWLLYASKCCLLIPDIALELSNEPLAALMYAKLPTGKE